MKKRNSIQNQTQKATKVLHAQRILKNTTIRRLQAENTRLRSQIRCLKNDVQMRSPTKRQPLDQLQSASQKRIRMKRLTTNLGSSLAIVEKEDAESN